MFKEMDKELNTFFSMVENLVNSWVFSSVSPMELWLFIFSVVLIIILLLAVMMVYLAMSPKFNSLHHTGIFVTGGFLGIVIIFGLIVAGLNVQMPPAFAPANAKHHLVHYADGEVVLKKNIPFMMPEYKYKVTKGPDKGIVLTMKKGKVASKNKKYNKFATFSKFKQGEQVEFMKDHITYHAKNKHLQEWLNYYHPDGKISKRIVAVD